MKILAGVDSMIFFLEANFPNRTNKFKSGFCLFDLQTLIFKISIINRYFYN